jgi:hypothetical protein
MENSKPYSIGKINMKIFQRLETCQRCRQLNSNKKIRHVTVGNTQKRICHDYYNKIKNNEYDWWNFTQWSG